MRIHGSVSGVIYLRAGLNAYNLSLDGYLRNTVVLATRLDYVVATDLNVFGTFFRAEPTPTGYGSACIGPNDGADRHPSTIAGSFPGEL